MRSLACLLIGSIALFSLQSSIAQEKKKEKEFDAKSMHGSWKLESGMTAGQKSDEERLAGEVTIDKDTFTMPAGPDAKFVMKYEIDASKSPMVIDFEIKEGPAEGKALGIFKVEDGKMTLCYNPQGEKRPEKFESTEENGNFLFTLSKADAKFEAKNLVGTWVYVSGTNAGAEVPDERIAGQVDITDKTITFPAGPDQEFVMSYKLDMSQSPVAIDMSIEEGPVAEGNAVGIIKFQDGKITLCYDGRGETRPTEFKSTEDNGFFLFEFTRDDN